MHALTQRLGGSGRSSRFWPFSQWPVPHTRKSEWVGGSGVWVECRDYNKGILQEVEFPIIPCRYEKKGTQRKQGELTLTGPLLSLVTERYKSLLLK